MSHVITTTPERTPSLARPSGEPGEFHGHVGRRLVLQGRVQGIGVRPAIFNLASSFNLAGRVHNTQRGVEIELEGCPSDLAEFERSLLGQLPQGAIVVHLERETCSPIGCREFTIVKEPTTGPLAARVPEDRALCRNCEQEICAPADRRFRYPFTSCTQCGPRYTVIRAMPFEREDTAMADFPLCGDCDQEYRRPGDRRFHAQTTACPVCGPRVTMSSGQEEGQALQSAIKRLRAGEIVGLRGLGGYQLLVDATNTTAVDRLRTRKGRQSKPLAVMVESLQAAERIGDFDRVERDAFLDPAAPIVVVRAKPLGGLAVGVHPDLDSVGLMRPTTPLHELLVRGCGRSLVCTSGNLEGEPLEYEPATVERRLAGVADVWLHHDREIVRPIDDSVVRIIAGRRVTLRLARGLAPLPLDLPISPPMIALGGFLKSAAAWSNGVQSVLGPHIGDQETLSARARFLAHLQDCRHLYRFQPTRLVHDLHPDYFSTEWAQQQGLPTLAIQHHHAHVVAGMLEHRWLDRAALGVAWDGTGYGIDGTIWGGEFLLCTTRSFQRVARLRPFRLPGGEAAIREPWRIAVALSDQLQRPHDTSLWPHNRIESPRVAAVRKLLAQPTRSPLTSSAGRLFDAAGAVILELTHANFDGQVPMRLEAVADRDAEGEYLLPLLAGEPPELDWRPLWDQLLADLRRGVEAGTMAMRFHRGLARGIVRVCRTRPELPVVLTGGVFQNRLLTELVMEEWGSTPQQLGLPGLIPPNDGGLAAGQLAIAVTLGSYLSCA